MDTLFIGDLHLEKNSRFFGLERGIELALRPLDHVADYARDHGINHIFQLGDVFETPYPSDHARRQLIQRLHEHRDLTFHFIPGNHDRDDTDNVSLDLVDLFAELHVTPNVRIYLAPREVRIKGIPFYMLPYPHEKPPRADHERVVLAHLELNGALRDNGHQIDGGLHVPQRDWWVIGHLHTPQTLGQRAIYSGSMAQHSFGETKRKGFLHSHIERHGRALRVRHRFIPYDPPWLLSNLVVERREDLRRIERDSLHLYKVFLGQDSRLPPDWRERHPNVREVQGFKDQRDLHDAQQDRLRLHNTPPDLRDPNLLLPVWLHERRYGNRRFIRTAVRLAAKALLVEQPRRKVR